MVLSSQVLFQLQITESAILIVLLLVSLLPKGTGGTELLSTNGSSEIRTFVRAIKIPRKQLIVLLLSLAGLAALLDCSVTVANAIFKYVFETKIPAWKGIDFYSVALLVAFAGFAIAGLLEEARGHPIWESKLLKLFAFVAFLFDIILAVLIPLVVPIWKTRSSTGPVIPETPEPVPSVGVAPILHFGLTVFRALVLAILLATLFSPRIVYEPIEQNVFTPQASETSLLIPAAVAASAQISPGQAASKVKYGTFNEASAVPSGNAPAPTPSTSGPASLTIPTPAQPTWYENGARLMRLISYLWPSKNFGLQLLALLCLLIVTAGRAINAAIPFQFGVLVDTLARPDDPRAFWGPLLWYISLRFLGGSGGLNALRNLLWVPVIQFSDRSLSQLAFDHLLNLSLAWHTRRKTGEVLRILDRGASIKQIFELLIFTLLPTVADTLIAVWIFFWYFGPALSVFIAITMIVYASLNLMSLSQNLVLTAGLLVGSLLIIFDPAHQHDIMKRYVVFITYLAELYNPLTTFALLYRSISQSLVDAERLLDLLNEPSEVRDKPDAKELVVTDGIIEFGRFLFLTELRSGRLFHSPKGGSVALVGESGSGKSTILKLLYRFYDLAPSDGAIRIDGQDIRDVTQASLRRAIGIVPQDCILFNNSITYNIGYGKFGSSNNEIENAARAAQIHERVTSFPDDYETVVGERGVRLSGGEKQRVAIARTILKASPIILLDEATSALDTSTERDIQKAIRNLTEGRSSVSVAHRLSTISKADLILVFHQGEIIESGTQRELTESDGRFAVMWADQVSSMDESRTPPKANEQGATETPGAGPAGPQIVPAKEFVPTGGSSKHPEPIKPEHQVPNSRSTHKVRPDVTFAAVASREATTSQSDSTLRVDKQ
ncbi:unnamed protein product [Rhizoctonia solani]|uniref:ABC transporter n=1 Tax=Rhizoctonia solani TaxID=456999 RepID=A0A8H3BL79_9AGAM|nr:unnamed protein product [Rhizoctonia solani]